MQPFDQLLNTLVNGSTSNEARIRLLERRLTGKEHETEQVCAAGFEGCSAPWGLSQGQLQQQRQQHAGGVQASQQDTEAGEFSQDSGFECVDQKKRKLNNEFTTEAGGSVKVRPAPGHDQTSAPLQRASSIPASQQTETKDTNKRKRSNSPADNQASLPVHESPAQNGKRLQQMQPANSSKQLSTG